MALDPIVQRIRWLGPLATLCGLACGFLALQIFLKSTWIRWVRWVQLVEHRSFDAVSLCYCYFMLFPLVHLVPSWVFSGYVAVGVLGQEGMTVLTVARLNKDILNYFAWVVSACEDCEACKPGDLIDVAVIQHIVSRWYSLQGPIGSPARRMVLSISMDTTDPDIMTDDCCAVTALSAGGFLDYALLHLLCAGWCHGLRRWSSEACQIQKASKGYRCYRLSYTGVWRLARVLHLPHGRPQHGIGIGKESAKAWASSVEASPALSMCISNT